MAIVCAAASFLSLGFFSAVTGLLALIAVMLSIIAVLSGIHHRTGQGFALVSMMLSLGVLSFVIMLVVRS